jgi:hypothetical protein
LETETCTLGVSYTARAGGTPHAARALEGISSSNSSASGRSRIMAAVFHERQPRARRGAAQNPIALGVVGTFGVSMMPPPLPGPDARLVGRARVASWLGFACVGALSAAGFADQSVGGYLAAVVCLLAGAFGIAAAARSRVWIDGDVLYARKLGGWGSPIRLDRLRQAWLAEGSPSILRLADDERELKLDAVNLRLKPLYAALAGYLGPDSPLPNKKLRRRMSRASRRGRLRRLDRAR